MRCTTEDTQRTLSRNLAAGRIGAAGGRDGVRGMMRRGSIGAGLLVLATAMSVRAESITIASFSDPAQDETTPLFEFDATTHELSGGWDGGGLTLETVTGTFENVTFSMSPLLVDAFGETQPGQVDFRDSGDTLIYRITFDSAHLTVIGFGATEFLATNAVQFSGPILPAAVLNESFSFAFANQTPMGPGGGFTATAAFTSSADLVPEPASAVLLVFTLAAAGSTRRRRRA